MSSRITFSVGHKISKLKSNGFSLFEVVLAIGVFSLTILAVLAMLGSTSRATSEILGATTASLIADGVTAELEAIGFDGIVIATGGVAASPNTPGTPVVLYATKDGRQVALELDSDLNTLIPLRDRFYQITLTKLVGPMGYDPGNPYIAVSLVLEWPYMIPTGPGINDGIVVAPDRRSQSRLNKVILLTQ